MSWNNSNDMLHFCDQLRKAREAAGLSQEDLAEQLDLSLTTIHRFESGKRIPSIDIVFRFMETTNTPLSSLVPSRFISQTPTSIDPSFSKLSPKNKQVVKDTTTTLISSLLLAQH